MTQDLSDLKLTKAQHFHLSTLSHATPDFPWMAFVGSERRAAASLAAKGLIEWSEKTGLGRITPAGRAALQALGGSDEQAE